MNTTISTFVICVEDIICLLLYNLHDCTFKSRDNLILKSKFFNAKIKLAYDLNSFQRECLSFLRNSSHMQGKGSYIYDVLPYVKMNNKSIV